MGLGLETSLQARLLLSQCFHMESQLTLLLGSNFTPYRRPSNTHLVNNTANTTLYILPPHQLHQLQWAKLGLTASYHRPMSSTRKLYLDNF